MRACVRACVVRACACVCVCVCVVCLSHLHSDLARFPAQPAMKFAFNVETRRWQSWHIRVRMDPVPFAVGGLRRVRDSMATRRLLACVPSPSVLIVRGGKVGR